MDYRAFFEEIKAGTVRQAYLFHGEEEYVKDRALEKLTGLLLPDFCEFNLSIMDDPAAADVASAAEQLPVMDERRIVLVKNSRLLTDSKQAEDGEKSDAPVLNYLKNPNPATMLVFFARGKCDSRKRIFKAVAGEGGAVGFDCLSEQELLPWLTRFAANKGGTLGRREAAHLVSVAGRSLMALTTELTKALDYSNGAPVTKEAIDLCVTPDVEQNVFRVMDEMLAGNKKNALLMLRSTVEKGGAGSEYGVLPAIASRVRMISDNKRAGRRDTFSRMFTEDELDDALVTLADLDIRMKSETLDAKMMIERAILGIFAKKSGKA